MQNQYDIRNQHAKIHQKIYILSQNIFHENSTLKAQWATKWTLGEKSKVQFCKIQLVPDILRTMDYLMALKVLLRSSSRVENELIKNN
jgi:hypothetical protein